HELELKSQELHSTAQQLKEANRLLQELHRQKDDFLSHVSHEVRTPMTSIRSFSEILRTERDLDRDQRDRFVATIHNESVRLTQLLDEILDLSVLEHGEREWECVPVAVEGTLDRAISVCEGLARKNQVRMENGRRAGAGHVLGDHGRMSQVFINIIANAISHNDAPDPLVRIDSRCEDGFHVVEISDNGSGIPMHLRESIFEKFVRARPDEAPTGRGLGLGLHISYKIVERLHGSIELVEGPLPGACFRIRLPLMEEARAGRGNLSGTAAH